MHSESGTGPGKQPISCVVRHKQRPSQPPAVRAVQVAIPGAPVSPRPREASAPELPLLGSLLRRDFWEPELGVARGVTDASVRCPGRSFPGGSPEAGGVGGQAQEAGLWGTEQGRGGQREAGLRGSGHRGSADPRELGRVGSPTAWLCINTGRPVLSPHLAQTLVDGYP